MGRTVMFIKPGNKRLMEVILCKILAVGLRPIFWGRVTLGKKTAETYYEDKQGKDWFEDLIVYITSEPVYVFVITGQDALEKVRAIKGKTWSAAGIRGLFAKDFIRNILHCSGDLQEFEKDIRFFGEIFGEIPVV